MENFEFSLAVSVSVSEGRYSENPEFVNPEMRETEFSISKGEV